MLFIGLHISSHAQVWKIYTATDGMVNNSVKCLALDNTGNICIATNGGFSIFNGTSFTNYNTSNGLPNNWVRSVVCDASGMIWLGTFSGISKFNGSVFTNYNTSNGLPSNNITSLSTATGGILWIGTASSGISKYNGSTFVNFTIADGLVGNSTKCLSTDLSNNIWIGTNAGLSKFDGTTFTNYTTADGLPSNSINALYYDPSGYLWIGTSAGLVKYDGSTFTNYTTANGLIDNIITAITKDNSGNLWIGYNVIGLTKFDGSSFINFMEFNGFTWGQETSVLSYQNLIYIGTNSNMIETRKWALPLPRYDNLDTNNIKAGFNSNGVVFEKPDMTAPNEGAGFEVPKGSGNTSFFAGNTWLGGFDQSNIFHLAAANFLGVSNSYIAGPINLNPLTYEFDSAWNRVWKISKTTIDFHIANFTQPGYVVPSSIQNWPAPTADYVDYNDNHLYDPQNGDYPLIRGDQAILTIYNDISTHTSGGQPLGVEIHALSYSFNSIDSALNNTVFTNYKIYNYSSNDYHDLYLGIYSDIDVGYMDDDYIGCDSTVSLFYAYNGDGTDTQYGTHIPAQGVVFLSSPISSFGYYTNTSGITGDPTTDVEHYYVLNGQWKDGTPYTYGGNGYGGTVTTNFCFSSDPNNAAGWSEVTEGYTPGDRRGVGVVGPFSMLAGKAICIDVAYPNAISFSGNYLNSVPLLKERTSQLISFYNSQSWDCGQIYTDTNTVPHVYTTNSTICMNSSFHFNNIVVGGTPPYIYSWLPTTGLNDPAVINPVANPTQTTTYIVTVTDHQMNSVVDTVIVTVDSPSVFAGNDTTLCNNNSLTLYATPGFQSYFWSVGGSSQTITFNQAHSLSGIINVVVHIWDSLSCTTTDTVIVNFLSAPDIDFGNDAILCNTQTLVLDAGAGSDHYLWSTGATTNSIFLDGSVLPLGTANYYVHAWNDNGCNDYDTINITVATAPDIFLGNDTILCNTEFLTIDAGAGADHYLWNTGSASNTILLDGSLLPLGINSFSVHAWNDNSCSDNDTILVDVQVCSGINELASDGFKIYPNPSEGVFYIESGQSYFARITDLKGVLVFEKQFQKGTEKINLKNISKGIYFLELQTDQKIFKTKLVLN